MGFKSGPSTSAGEGYKITKSTTNNTLNFGLNNNNGGDYGSITGAMGNVRAGTVVGQINTTNLGASDSAYGSVAAAGILVTDTIVATPVGSYKIHINNVTNGGFFFTAANDSGVEVTAHASNASAQIKFNWVAL